MAKLGEYIVRHVVLTAQSSSLPPSRARDLEIRLRRASQFFGAERDLASIRVDDVRGFRDWLQHLPNGRGGTLEKSLIGHHLSALSDLYRRAGRERHVPAGYNPVLNPWVKASTALGAAGRLAGPGESSE